MNRGSMATACVVSIFLMIVVGAASWYLGDPASIVFRNVLLTPLFLLATKGLRASFPDVDNKRGLRLRSIFEVLDAALLAAFITIVVSNPDTRLDRALLDFSIITALVAVANILVFIYRDRARRKPD